MSYLLQLALLKLNTYYVCRIILLVLFGHETIWLPAMRCHPDEIKIILRFMRSISKRRQPHFYDNCKTMLFLVSSGYLRQLASSLIGPVNECPTMHYFGNPRHTQSMIAYVILTEYFWKFQGKVALWECC